MKITMFSCLHMSLSLENLPVREQMHALTLESLSTVKVGEACSL